VPITRRQPELAARRKQLCASGFRSTQRRILTRATRLGVGDRDALGVDLPDRGDVGLPRLAVLHQRRVILGFEQSQPVQAGHDALRLGARLGAQVGGRLGATALKVGRRL
jgi:hypothetical protein